MKYIHIQEHIEKVQDKKLKQEIMNVANSLEIAITCMEENDFINVIKKCETIKNVKPLRDELKCIIFRKKYKKR